MLRARNTWVPLVLAVLAVRFVVMETGLFPNHIISDNSNDRSVIPNSDFLQVRIVSIGSSTMGSITREHAKPDSELYNLPSSNGVEHSRNVTRDTLFHAQNKDLEREFFNRTPRKRDAGPETKHYIVKMEDFSETVTSQSATVEHDVPTPILGQHLPQNLVRNKMLPGICLNDSTRLSRPYNNACGNKACSVQHCAELCTVQMDCVSWTLFQKFPVKCPAQSFSNLTDGQMQGLCVLRSEFHSPCGQFESWRKCMLRASVDTQCVSGLMRVGKQKTSIAPHAVNVTQSAKKFSTADVNLAHIGQCNNHTCLDVFHCASRDNRIGKYAFILTHDLERSSTFVGSNGVRIQRTQRYKRLIALAKEVPADVVLMVPNSTVAKYPLTESERRQLNHDVIKVFEVPWVVPKHMIYKPPRRWCGLKDFVRLNAWTIKGYDAVIMYDADILVRGNMLPVFQCAAQNKLLMTSGLASPCNLGFAAFRPDPRVQQAALYFLAHANYSDIDGWGGAGFWPKKNKFIGSECGQGVFWTLFYNNGLDRDDIPLVETSFLQAGLQARPEAYQVDMCTWNFQRWGQYKQGYGWLGNEVNGHCDFSGMNCASSVMAIHKPFDVRDRSQGRIVPQPQRMILGGNRSLVLNATQAYPRRIVPRDFDRESSWRCTEGFKVV